MMAGKVELPNNLIGFEIRIFTYYSTFIVKGMDRCWSRRESVPSHDYLFSLYLACKLILIIYIALIEVFTFDSEDVQNLMAYASLCLTYSVTYSIGSQHLGGYVVISCIFIRNVLQEINAVKINVCKLLIITLTNQQNFMKHLG